MKVTNKVIMDVVSQVAGEDVVPLVKILKTKKNISEFLLAEKIDEEVNKTRNMLYRLYNANLVSFIRKKDKKKGWYIYYWTFNQKRIKDILVDLRKRRLETLNERLTRENDNFFFLCDNKCVRLNFEQATDFQFKCPECGSLLGQDDNANIIKDIKNEIKELKKKLKEK